MHDPAPDTCLEKVTWNLICEHGLDARLNVVEALPADHRVRKLGEVAHLGDRHRSPIRLARTKNDRAAVVLRFAQQREQRYLATNAGQMAQFKRSPVQQ